MLQSPSRQASLAIGLGVRHEAQGINVLLGRVAAGRSVDAWRFDGNALFEKPYATGRDAVDLITTFGVARQVRPALAIGVELIGEDLEGFWEEDEAEGGARVLIGPSIRVAVAHEQLIDVEVAVRGDERQPGGQRAGEPAHERVEAA